MIKIKECRKIMKLCKDCGELKLIKQFKKNKPMKDGYYNFCEKCRYIRMKKYKHICENCSKEFIGTKTQKFCGIECKNKFHSEHLKGDKNPFYGKKHSEETKKKMSENHADFSGENHPMWNNSITQEERETRDVLKRVNIEYKEWRHLIFERDSYTCQCCGDNKGGNLNAHHLNGYDKFKEQRYDVDNGITLCIKCHKEFHKKYGKGNNTLEDFKEFYKDKTGKDFKIN